MRTNRNGHLVLAAAMGLLITTSQIFAENPNPRVLPIESKAYGKSYGDWGACWWRWALGIPEVQNPILDPDGSFADIDQQGPVWFLAGTFGGSATRDVCIPEGKAIFFPLVNATWWAPDDLEFAAMVAADEFGLDPATLTPAELIELMAVFQTTFDDLEMTVTVDGKPLKNLTDYYAISDEFPIDDTDLLDDFGIPIADENFAISAGYWVMLAPLPPGEHTIRFTVDAENDFFGPFDLDVTYNITVK